MTTYRLIWSAGAIQDWHRNRNTRRFLAHAISGIDSPQTVAAFTRQFRSGTGTPWLLVEAATGRTVNEGVS